MNPKPKPGIIAREMARQARRLEEIEGLPNEELLDYITASRSSECVTLMHERRCKFWDEYRAALLDLQHLVLQQDKEPLRQKIGALLDRTHWMWTFPINEQPLGGLLVDRLRITARQNKALKKRLKQAHEILKLDDEIFRMNGSVHKKKVGKQNASNLSKR